MADISITQAHTMPHEEAKSAAQKIADQLAQEYDMTLAWAGDVLRFERSGLSGMLTVSDKHAQVEISLGFLMQAFAPMIEEKIRAKMKKVFAGAL